MAQAKSMTWSDKAEQEPAIRGIGRLDEGGALIEANSRAEPAPQLRTVAC